MNICKNCKFWGNEVTGTCSGTNGNIKRKRSTYHTDLEFSIDKPDGFDIYADASDDTGLESYLVTGPNFGCNNFKPIQ